MMMKLILFQIILFGNLCFSANGAMAQQAKAYETVKYTARIKNYVFRLDYADGYIGASKIRLISTRQKAQIFTQQSGTPEADGNFVLSLSSGADKRQIILTGINEEQKHLIPSVPVTGKRAGYFHCYFTKINLKSFLFK